MLGNWWSPASIFISIGTAGGLGSGAAEAVQAALAGLVAAAAAQSGEDAAISSTIARYYWYKNQYYRQERKN
jgi:hypothetical protein